MLAMPCGSDTCLGGAKDMGGWGKGSTHLGKTE